MPVDPLSHLYFESYGPQDAQSVVFLHGGGVGGWMWSKQVQMFETEYHCLAPDLPEQGRSTQSGAYSTEGAADSIAELIHSQAPSGKAHVVGLSEGAQVLVALLSRSPQVIDHAIVSSAMLRPLPNNYLYSREVVAWSYRLFLAPFKHNNWWIRLNMHNAAGIADEYFEDFKTSFQETSEASLVDIMVNSLKFRLPVGLEKVDLPVLVIVGSKEYKQMKQSAQDLLAVLPNARGVIVSLGAGASLVQEHNWAMTAPQLFNDTLKAWIEDLPLPPGLLPLEKA
ncbi:MAG: alpha/beta hydrolase [Anaerolineaceae bacterium]|nr:alpha/beta hydrolase [Anaerolineaceae bacterium]